jgi:putative Mg2+ transporter-C (MgtC) family protein
MGTVEKEMLLRLGVAILLGAVVGIEREYRSKSAGFRTMILISLGACLFTMLSIAIGAPGSPDRIASNIATGIGFLGAGVIFRSENRVTGITTAATIWAVAAIGMAVGSGHERLAIAAGLLIVTVLALLPYAQLLIDTFNQAHTYTITIMSDSGLDAAIEAEIKHLHLNFIRLSMVRENNLLTISWRVHGRAKAHHAFTEKMLRDKGVLRFEA